MLMFCGGVMGNKTRPDSLLAAMATKTGALKDILIDFEFLMIWSNIK